MKKIIIFFLLIFFVFCKEDKSIIKNDNLTKIGILPYNGMEKSYGFTVKILPSIQAPKNAFINVKNLRYRADSLIKYQKTLIKKYKITYILGLCNLDISTTKTRESLTKYQDWGGIIGLVYRPGNSYIISPFRLKTNIFERFNKVAIHEFGRNLGLSHCIDKKCVMTSAGKSIKTIDNANMKLWR